VAVAADQQAEPPRGKHVQSGYGATQVRPATFHPHAHDQAQVSQTVGVNPDPPAERQAAPEISPAVPYMGGSPTGYDPATLGTF